MLGGSFRQDHVGSFRQRDPCRLVVRQSGTFAGPSHNAVWLAARVILDDSLEDKTDLAPESDAYFVSGVGIDGKAAPSLLQFRPPDHQVHDGCADSLALGGSEQDKVHSTTLTCVGDM